MANQETFPARTKYERITDLARELVWCFGLLFFARFGVGILLAYVLVTFLIDPIRDLSEYLSVRLEEAFVSSRFFTTHEVWYFSFLFHWEDFSY